MSDWVVACPECATHFRVTAAHRDAAGGLVRCGACLAVFRAGEHRGAAAVGDPASDEGAGPGARLDVAPVPEVAADEDEDEDDRVASRRAGDASVGDDTDTDTHFGAGAGHDRADEPEDARRGDVDALHARRHRSVLELAPEQMLARGLESVRAHLDAGAPTARPAASDAPGGARRSDAATPGEPPEPSPAPPRRPGRTGRWLAVLVVAAAGLAVQTVVWRFDALALDPSTRPALLAVCEVLDCRVPSPLEPDAIRSRGLLVRSHPERADGLLADAVLVNEGDFPQPFPDVELRFSDIRGAVLAVRRFAPGEYLAGELAGRREMPAGSPVRISIGLVDPGPSAVNYEMRLHPRRAR